jgi:hypothetical protein
MKVAAVLTGEIHCRSARRLDKLFDCRTHQLGLSFAETGVTADLAFKKPPQYINCSNFSLLE